MISWIPLCISAKTQTAPQVRMYNPADPYTDLQLIINKTVE